MASVRGVTDLKKMRQPVRDQVFAALYAAADAIRADAAHSITAGSISGKGHVPSRPGEPPNADTRQLDTSIVVQPHKERMAVQVVVLAPHGVFQEFGTVKMAARPFLRPALARNKASTSRFVRTAVSKAIRSVEK